MRLTALLTMAARVVVPKDYRYGTNRPWTPAAKRLNPPGKRRRKVFVEPVAPEDWSVFRGDSVSSSRLINLFCRYCFILLQNMYDNKNVRLDSGVSSFVSISHEHWTVRSNCSYCQCVVLCYRFANQAGLCAYVAENIKSPIWCLLFMFLCFCCPLTGWDSCREGQGKTRKSDPSLQTQKLGDPWGTKYSKEVPFVFPKLNLTRLSFPPYLYINFRQRIISLGFTSTRGSECIFASIVLVSVSNQKPLGFDFCFLCSITGMLGKLQITAGPTLPLKLPSWCVMSASLILQTGNSKLVKLTFCLIFVKWIFIIILISQEAHRGGVEIHRGRWEGPSVSQDGPNHSQAGSGTTRQHRATAMEGWDSLCLLWLNFIPCPKHTASASHRWR